MSIHIKVGGTWRQVSEDTDSQCGYVKVSGTWRTVSDAYVKVNGSWRTVCSPTPTPTPNPNPTPNPSSCVNPTSCINGVAAGYSDGSYSPPTEACTTASGASGTRTAAWTCNTPANCPDIYHPAGTCVATPTSTPCCQDDDAGYCTNVNASGYGDFYQYQYDPCALSSCPAKYVGRAFCGVASDPCSSPLSTTSVLLSNGSCASGQAYYTVRTYASGCPLGTNTIFDSCYVAPVPVTDCSACSYGTYTQSCGTYGNGTQTVCVTPIGCNNIYGSCVGDYNPNPTPTVNCNSCPYGSGYTACGTYGNGSRYYCITPVGCADIYGSCVGDYNPNPAPNPTPNPTPNPSPCVASAGNDCGRYGNGYINCSGQCVGDRCC